MSPASSLGCPRGPGKGLLPRRKGQSRPQRWGLGLDWLRRSLCLALAAFVGRPLPTWAGSHRVPLQTLPRRGGWGCVGVSPAVAPVPGRPSGGWFPRLAEPLAPAGSISEARAPCWAGRAVLRPPPRRPHTGPTPSKYQAWRWGVGGCRDSVFRAGLVSLAQDWGVDSGDAPRVRNPRSFSAAPRSAPRWAHFCSPRAVGPCLAPSEFLAGGAGTVWCPREGAADATRMSWRGN